MNTIRLLFRAASALFPAVFLAGCARAPEFSIYGSFFPVWIFCSVAGLLLMAGVRALVARSSFAEHLVAPVLLYLSLTIFFTCALWLLFFS